MTHLTFRTPQDMCDHILTNHDLYNPKTNRYVFSYNDDNAIAVYHITHEHAKELQNQIQKSNTDHYWSCYLSNGGKIFDNPQDFCNEHYHEPDWINANDFNK